MHGVGPMKQEVCSTADVGVFNHQPNFFFNLLLGPTVLMAAVLHM